MARTLMVGMDVGRSNSKVGRRVEITESQKSIVYQFGCIGHIVVVVCVSCTALSVRKAKHHGTT